MKEILRIQNYILGKTSDDGYVTCKDTGKTRINEKTGKESKIYADRKFPSSLQFGLKDLSRRILDDKLTSEYYKPTIDEFRKALYEHFRDFEELTKGL